jgi:hypothetical protein
MSSFSAWLSAGVGDGGAEAGEAGAIDRAAVQPRGVGVEVAGGEAAAVGAAGVHAQAEHQQPVVLDAAEAFEFAADEHRAELAVEGAVERFVLQPLDAEIERGLPRAAEGFGAGLAAEPVGALGAHVHRPRGALDGAGIGERADERLLPLGRPAIVAVLARDGLERGEGVAGGLHLGDGGAGGGGVLAAGHMLPRGLVAVGNRPGSRILACRKMDL